MQPDYKNWVPKGMVTSFFAATSISSFALGMSLISDTVKKPVKIALATVTGACAAYSAFCINWYNTFSYNGKKKFAKHIIDSIAEYVDLPDGGIGLDVGCGSGALAISCAKRNPNASMIGLDRWGKEYASFTKPLCESNAIAEGVEKNTSFVQGDACKLDFPDEYFDAVTSNYVYHNIHTLDHQKLIYETLRVLKKGGTFAIHDLYTGTKYGDMCKLVQNLKDEGYEKVELLDTTNGLFMTKKEATTLFLNGSALLVGKK